VIATGPPGKRNGASHNAPIPNHFVNCPRSTSVRSPLQAGAANVDPTPLVCSAQTRCEHGNTRIERLASGPHFAKEVCTDCGRVLRFVPKPANIERQRFNALRLAKLSMHPGLSPFERNFLASIAQQKKLSPAQQKVFDDLCAKYLEQKAQKHAPL
jgi:hypothetical protein